MAHARYRSDFRSSFRRARKFVFGFLLGSGFWLSQRTGLLGELDLTQQYVGTIAVLSGVAALVCAVREFLAFAVKIGPDQLTIRDPYHDSEQTFSAESIETLHLAGRRRKREYRLDVACSDSPENSVVLWTRDDFQVVAEQLRQFYPATTADPRAAG